MVGKTFHYFAIREISQEYLMFLTVYAMFSGLAGP